MNLEKELLDLKAKAETLTKRMERATWERDQILKELKDKWGVKSVTEAENLTKTLEVEIEESEKALEKELTEIKTKYSEMLEMV